MILVTGAAGFIGYQIAKTLKQKGHKIIAVDEKTFFQTRAEHADLQPDLIAAPFDAATETFFAEQKSKGQAITAVIHMGACSSTTEMRTDFLTKVNVDYSRTLWNLCIQYKIPFIYASSAATYGAGEHGYSDDESIMHKLQPLNPYGRSKLQFDLWALEQEKTGKAPPAWSGFKFFNVYGYGERHKGKMASVVLQGFDQIREHGKLKLFKSHKAGIADGEQKRDFVYIKDVVDILIYALEKPLPRGIYNLGSGKARSFHDLAKATFKALGKPANIEFIDTPVEIRDRYQYFTQASMEKLRGAGYTAPMTELEVGVAETVRALSLRS